MLLNDGIPRKAEVKEPVMLYKKEQGASSGTVMLNGAVKR